MGAVLCTSLSFGNTLNFSADSYKPEAKQNVSPSLSLQTSVRKVAAVAKAWYIVEFESPCGGHMTVWFASSYPDGSAGFINDLAYAVNSGATQACDRTGGVL